MIYVTTHALTTTVFTIMSDGGSGTDGGLFEDAPAEWLRSGALQASNTLRTSGQDIPLADGSIVIEPRSKLPTMLRRSALRLVVSESLSQRATS